MDTIMALKANAKATKLDSIRTMRPNAPENRGSEYYDGAVLTFTDDDGTTRFLNEHVPVYKAHGVTATTAVVACRAITTVGTTTSGDPYEAMSFEQLRELSRDGFDVQSHTWSHARNCFNSNYNQSATDADIDLEYRLADEALRANGFDYNCMVFPWGAYQNRHLSLARRYARFGVNCRGRNGMNDANTNPMDLNRLQAQAGNANINNMKSSIDTAIANKYWLIILTHAGDNQPSAATLDAVLTYAQTAGIRIENFTEAARLKAPAFYAGKGDGMFRVMPSGETKATLDDASVSKLIARAYALGCITPAVNTIDSITAAWTGGTLNVGAAINRAHITVTANLHDNTTRAITDFTVTGATAAVSGDNVLTVKYGALSTTVTVTATAGSGSSTPDTALGTYTTVFPLATESDTVWLARHMDAGTYNYTVTLSAAMGTNAASSDIALALRTASEFGEKDGTSLISVTAGELAGQTTLSGSFTLAAATDGFYLYARLAKKGVAIQIEVDGSVTDSTLLDGVAPILTMTGTNASAGTGWAEVNLAAGTYPFTLSVGGGMGNNENAITIKAASSDSATDGETLLTLTNARCQGGISIMGAITLTAGAPYLYMKYHPRTGSTFTATLSM